MRLAAVVFTVLLHIAALTFPLQSQTAARLEDPDWVRDVRNKAMVYNVPGMDKVEIRKNVTYKKTAGTEQKADIYMPPNLRKNERRPVIIFIHGGYLPPNLLTPPKEWVEYKSFGRLAAASGFIGVVFNHRFFSNFSSLPDSQADLSDVIAFVRSHAPEFNADADRITLWAFSGGGYLLSQPLREPMPYIRGLVAYYTILDFTPTEKAMPDRLPGDIAKKFSAVQALIERGHAIPPIFVARAGLDHPLRNGTIDHFIELALAGNAPIQVVNHPTGHHGFDVEDDNERSREIIRSTLEFIRAWNAGEVRQ